MLLSIAALLAVMLLAATAVAGWLLYSQSGAGLLWAQAVAASDGQLDAAGVSGSLRRGVVIDGLEYRAGELRIRIQRIGFAVDPDLLPPGLALQAVRVNGLQVRLPPPGDGAGGDDTSVSGLLAGLQLPLPVALESLELADARVLDASGATAWSLDRLQLRGALYERLQIDGLTLVAADTKINLRGSLGLSAPNDLESTIAVRTRLPAPDGKRTLAATLDLGGNLEQLQLRVTTADELLDLRGSIDDPAGTPRADVVATGGGLRWPIGGETLRVDDLRLRVSGSPDNYQATVSAALGIAGVDRMQLDGDLQGSLASLRIARLSADATPLSATLSGDLGWQDGLSFSGRLELGHLAPAHWLADWPASQTVAGRLQAGYGGSRLEIGEVELRLAGSDAAVQGGGVVDLEAGVIDLGLQTRSLQWPLPPEVATLTSPEARLTVRGSPDDWQVAGDVALTTADLPDGRFAIAGGGNRESLQLAIENGRVLGGDVSGRVRYAWREPGRWSADLETRGLQVESLAPSWPGKVSATLRASGQVAPFELLVEIPDLEGELRSRPVTASGALQVAAGRISAESLVIRSGNSRIRLDGSMQSTDGLAFGAALDSLADYLPGVTGRVEAEGRLYAGEPLPRLELELSGSDIGWRDWHVATLEVSNAPQGREQPFALALAARDLSAGTRRFNEFEASLAGSPADHRLVASLAATDSRAGIDLVGGAQGDLLPLATARWQGRLDAFDVALDDETRLQLRDSAELALGAGRIELAESCFDVNVGGGACAAFQRAPDGSFKADLGMSALPLDLLRAALGGQLRFTQSLDGKLQLSADAGGRLSAGGRFDLSPGEIRNEFDERLTLRTRAGFAELELQQGRLLAGELSLPFSDAAAIRGNFRVTDVARGSDSEISGSLAVDVGDIGAGARILPQVDDAGGRLRARFAVDGTLAAPRYEGELRLEDGRVAYNPLGVRVTDIHLQSDIRSGNRLQLEGSFVAGDGLGSLRGSSDYLADPGSGFELAIAGEGLRLVDLDDLRIVVDPDLQLSFGRERISIDGRLAIPSARLASVNLVSGGVSESDDVVYVGEAQPVEKADAAAGSPFSFAGNLALSLGDDVVIDLDVAEARLAGSTDFQWQGPALPQARGAFQLSGKFEAYGQLLEITEGSIRWPGIPADNPTLRIRAEREIFGNSQVRRAGVLVTGSALQPQVEVYTNPATSQDRALSLLATGSDFNYEQGVGAVDVGTYIAPDLYASYGIGLFDKENVISVRYDLARGFGIKATSGKRAAGIDISYTITK